MKESKVHQQGGEICKNFNTVASDKALEYFFSPRSTERFLKLGCLEKEPEVKSGFRGSVSNLLSKSRIRTFVLRKMRNKKTGLRVYMIDYCDEDSSVCSTIKVSDIDSIEYDDSEKYIEISVPGRVYELFLPDKMDETPEQKKIILQKWKQLFIKIRQLYSAYLARKKKEMRKTREKKDDALTPLEKEQVDDFKQQELELEEDKKQEQARKAMREEIDLRQKRLIEREPVELGGGRKTRRNTHKKTRRNTHRKTHGKTHKKIHRNTYKKKHRKTHRKTHRK